MRWESSELVVTAPAVDPGLVSLATLKLELGISGSAEDALLTSIINGASAQANSYVGRVLQAQNYTETWYDLPPSQCLPIDFQTRVWPLIAINGFPVNPSKLRILDKGDGRLRLTDTSAFVVVNDDFGFPVGYTAGYATIPLDVQRAVLDMCKVWYQARGSASQSIQGESLGDYSVTYGPGRSPLPPSVRAVLDQYRAPVLA